MPHRPKLRGAGTASAKHVGEEVAHARAAVATMRAGDKPVSDVTAADLRALLTTEAARPAVARHRFGALSRFFDWCQDEGHVAANPCSLVAKVRRPRAVAARAHFLDLEQLARVWNAADELLPVHRDLVRFIVAVPCRRGEAARLDWSHLDLGAAVWTQPGRLTKNGGLHRIHLHNLALALLRERHTAAGKPTTGLVFPAPQSGGPIDTFSDVKTALDNAAGLAGWRYHDLRRSFATALGERGIPEPVADAVLNHRQAGTRGGVLGVYQRAGRWPEQVAAMERWGEILAAALDGRVPAGGADMAPMRRRA